MPANWRSLLFPMGVPFLPAPLSQGLRLAPPQPVGRD
jgi:hypothetical protein